jgi:hypothetical protein
LHVRPQHGDGGASRFPAGGHRGVRRRFTGAASHSSSGEGARAGHRWGGIVSYAYFAAMGIHCQYEGVQASATVGLCCRRLDGRARPLSGCEATLMKRLPFGECVALHSTDIVRGSGTNTCARNPATSWVRRQYAPKNGCRWIAAGQQRGRVDGGLQQRQYPAMVRSEGSRRILVHFRPWIRHRHGRDHVISI